MQNSPAIEICDGHQPTDVVGPALITLTYAEIPAYLHESAFYSSLDADDGNDIPVPQDSFKFDDSVSSVAEYALMLRTMEFWGVVQIPVSVVQFCANNELSTWKIVPGFVNQCTNHTLLTGYFRDTSALYALDYMKQIAIVGHWMDTNPPHTANATKATVHAASRGYLPLLQTLHSRGYIMYSDTAYRAISHDNLDCLQFVCANGVICNEGHCELAARRGRIECLKLLRENGCPWNQATICASAAEASSGQCFLFALEQHCVLNPHMDIDNFGNRDSLGYALEHGRAVTDNDTFHVMHEQKSLAMLRVLRLYHAPWDESVHAAALCCDLEALQFVQLHGCPYNDNIAQRAAVDGSLAKLQFLIEDMLLPLTEELFTVTLLYGSVDAVKYLVDVDCPCSFVALSYTVDQHRRSIRDADILESVVYAQDHHGWLPNNEFLNYVRTHYLPLCREHFPPADDDFVPAVVPNRLSTKYWQTAASDGLQFAAARNDEDQFHRILCFGREEDLKCDDMAFSAAIVNGSADILHHMHLHDFSCEFVQPDAFLCPAVLDDAQILKCIEHVRFAAHRGRGRRTVALPYAGYRSRGGINSALVQFVFNNNLPLCQKFLIRFGFPAP